MPDTGWMPTRDKTDKIKKQIRTQLIVIFFSNHRDIEEEIR